MLLGTDGIQLEGLLFVPQDDPLNTRFSAHTVIGGFLAVFIVVNALLFLNPRRILRSEVRPLGKLERTVLSFAGANLLLMGPFYLVYLFAAEGISNYPDRRKPDLVAVDIPRPFAFLKALKEYSDSPGGHGGGPPDGKRPT